MKPKKYVIKGPTEETDCDHCGCPLYNCDSAYYWAADDGEVFCSTTCAVKALDGAGGVNSGTRNMGR